MSNSLKNKLMVGIGSSTLALASVGSCFADDSGAGTVISTAMTGLKTEVLAAFGLMLVPALAIFGFKFVTKQGFTFFKTTTK